MPSKSFVVASLQQSKLLIYSNIFHLKELYLYNGL